MHKERLKRAIEAIRAGKMIIVMDDEDRENEGDLVLAGIFSTPEKINFMASHARGLICVSLTAKLAKKFELNHMVSHNDSAHETAFTISIDAREAKTGISAYERDMTIKLLCEDHTSANDFVRPGHIFPLIAKDGGTLVRTGHTEASVDICKLAGLKPVSVICEIMKEDGTMARVQDNIEFAKKHNLEILYVSDIIKYRLEFENLILLQGSAQSSFLDIPCIRYDFKDNQNLNHNHSVYAFGNVEEKNNPLVKFHHIVKDHEYFQRKSEDIKIFIMSVRMLQEGGYLVCLDGQKDRNQKNVQKNESGSDDVKIFGIGAQILRFLRVKNFRLLSQNTENTSRFKALGGFGLDVSEIITIGTK